MAAKTAQKAPERPLEAIQASFASTMRQKASLEASRRARNLKAFQAYEEAEAAAKAARKALDLILADDPTTQAIGTLNAEVDGLKAEAAEHYSPLGPLTFRDEDGAGFQYRGSTKTVIANEETLAKALIDQHLWQDIGASLSVSTTKAAQILKTHSLPGLSVEPSVTVAAYGPSKEN